VKTTEIIYSVDKNPVMFSFNVISFPLKKEIHEHLGWHWGE